MKRITSIPGVTVLPYWQAPKYTPGGIREIRAIAWHMAQGGGTDSWLTRQDGKQGNNSCHIVVKYDGAIRQLVEFDDASWSLHNDIDADPYDARDFGIFDFKYVKAALGTGFTDPNRYIIAIEVEGYFDIGPNTAQRKTILALATFLEVQFPKAVHLGHRDFQDYKPCPGKYLFTNLLPHASRLGGSTPAHEDIPMIDGHPMNGGDGIVTLKPGRGLINLVTGNTTIPADTVKTSYCRFKLAEPFGEGEARQYGYLVRHANQAHMALDDVVASFVPTEVPTTTVDPNPALIDRITTLETAIEQINSIVDNAA